MNKLITGKIIKVSPNQKLFTINYKNGRYLVFRILTKFQLKLNDSVTVEDNFGSQAIYHTESGDRFSATVEAIDITFNEVLQIEKFE